jgi:hypothetical protein
MEKHEIERDLGTIDALWKKHIAHNIRYLGRPSQNGPELFSQMKQWNEILQDYFHILLEMSFLAQHKENLTVEENHLLTRMDYSMYWRANGCGRDEGGGSIIKRNLIDYHNYAQQLWSTTLKPMPIPKHWQLTNLHGYVRRLLYDMMIFFKEHEMLFVYNSLHV